MILDCALVYQLVVYSWQDVIAVAAFFLSYSLGPRMLAIIALLVKKRLLLLQDLNEIHALLAHLLVYNIFIISLLLYIFYTQTPLGSQYLIKFTTLNLCQND
jgi:hypothetical protein